MLISISASALSHLKHLISPVQREIFLARFSPAFIFALLSD
jgi:hypothetical protein